MLAQLLQKNADVLEARDVQGLTPYLSAVYWGQRELVEVLVEHGADVHAVDLEGGSAVWVLINSPFAYKGLALLETLQGYGVDTSGAIKRIQLFLDTVTDEDRSEGYRSLIKCLEASKEADEFVDDAFGGGVVEQQETQADGEYFENIPSSGGDYFSNIESSDVFEASQFDSI